jgi:RHS repeat-associated protein
MMITRLMRSVVCLVLLASFAAAAQPVDYQDDFQSYGAPSNPSGWVDTSISGSNPNGLYKTWRDPLLDTNIVFGTKQASGQPDGNNPRIGTFSTLTTKTFGTNGRFEYRGRFFRGKKDTRVGLTFLSSYPEGSSYYLIGAWPSGGGGRFTTMQLFAHGAGTLSGTVDSAFTVDEGKWYRFAIHVEDFQNATTIRARFWLDGTAEPATYSIDASDGTAARLKQGRIGIWSAVKGEAYVDDLQAKSPVDRDGPVVTFSESGTTLVPNTVAQFNRDARIDVQATDLTGVASLTITLDGSPYVPLAPISTEGMHTVKAVAIDAVGNRTESQVQVLVDHTAPLVRVTGVTEGLLVNRAAVPVFTAEDITSVTLSATLDGAPIASGTSVAAEGAHTLFVTATNSVGFTTVVTVHFTIDLTPPALTISAPSANERLAVQQAIVRGTSDGVRVTINDIVASDPASFAVSVQLFEGANTLKAIATDAAGNTTTVAIPVTLDTLAPELTIAAPQSELCTNAETIVVRGIARDDGTTVRVRVNAGAWRPATVANGEYTANVPLAGEGTMAIEVEATDSTAHVSNAFVAVTADRTKPVIRVSESSVPLTRAFFSRNVLPFVDVLDADERVQAVVTLDGAAWTIGTPVETEGQHVLRVTAADCAGNAADAFEHTFTIDRTAPSIASIAPANDAVLGGQTRITGTLSEPATITANGVEGTVDGLAFSIDLPLAEGLNPIALVLVDRAGNESRVRHALRLRTGVPVVEIVENGRPIAANALFNRAVAPVIRSTDVQATITATLNGQPFTSGNAIEAEGSYTLIATATNAAGRVSDEARATFTIDRTAPVVTLTVPPRTDSDTIEVHGTFNEEASRVIVNGVPATIAGQTFTATIRLEEGTNAIAAVVTDRAGNHGRATAEVVRGSGRLAILLSSPPDDFLTNRTTVVVAGQVLTPKPGTIVRINGSDVALDPAGAFRKTGLPLVEGINVITAVVVDGGITNEVSVDVHADFTAPALTVTADGAPLADGMRFRISPAIAIAANDERAGVTTRVILDGSEVAQIGALGNGGHTLSVIARDAAGNETRIDRVFFVGDSIASEGCGLDSIDPVSGTAVSATTIRISGRSGGAASVLINGNAAQVSNGSFCGEATLEPGRNEVVIRCADASGTPTAEAPVTLVIHRETEPSIAIASPAEGATLTNGTVTVSGTVSDGVLSGDVNGIPFEIARGTTAFAVPNVTLAAGLNVITARAKNGAGRTGIATARVTLLDAAPQLTITSPVTGTETGAASIDVSGTYLNVDPSTIRINGAPVATTPRTATNGTFRADVSLGTTNTITATARNHAGNATTASVNVLQVAGAPTIAITSPADNAIVDGATVRVTGTIASDDGSQVQVNGTHATISGTTFTADVPVGNGTTALLARVTAPDGDDSIDAVRVTRFAAALAVRDTFPANNATGVDRGAAIIVLFNNTLETPPQIRLTNAAGQELSGATFVDRDAITFAPNAPLAANETYTVAVGSLTTFAFTTASSAPAASPVVDDVVTEGCLAGATITGRASNAGARVRLDVDGVTLTTTATATGAFRFTFTFSGQPGFHLARVRELGTDGSASPDRAICFRVDCDLPRVTSAALDRESKTLVITFSRAMDPSTLVVGSTILLGDLTGTLSMNATNDVATIAIAADLPATDLTLTVKKSIKDAAGASPAADYTQLFAAGGDAGQGRGFVSGAIYDATTGRPLANATVTIGGATLTTNARGRYSRSLDEGAYTLEASAPGYTHAWRQVVVPAGSGIVPIDIRLTKRGTGLTDGGDTSVTKPAEVTNGVVTAIGGQSLAGLLPLGWSPLASAEMVGMTAPSTLTFTINAAEVRNAAQVLSLVHYESDRDEWRVDVAAVNIPDDGRVAHAIMHDGHYALVYPDAAPHLAHPPAPRGGAALAGVTPPVATANMTARQFAIEPRAILPNGRAVATLVTEGATETYPSGSALQATIDEQLNLADGRVLADPPFATDLLVYRTLAGDAGIADFHLAPSAQAAAVTLRDGVEHVRIVDYPGRIDRGSLVGAEGGRVPGDGGITLDIPAGATTDALHATTATLDPASFGSIAGFRIAAAFELSLTNASDSQADPSLLLPARATFAVSGEVAHQVIVAAVLGDTPFGTVVTMVAIAERSGTVYTTRAIDSTQLPLDGIVRGGRYLILVSDAPVAFAFGQVRNASDVAVDAARVSTSLGVTSLTSRTGLFVLPVPATPASPFALFARTANAGDGAPKTASVAPDAGAYVDFGVLPFAAQPPQLRSVTPDGGEVAVGTNLVVRAEFDRAIDASSVANGIRVANLADGATVAGTVTAAGNNVTFVASELLRAASVYSITIAPAIRATNGTPFGETVVKSFRTPSIPAGSTSIRPERIRITLPDDTGRSNIRGLAGALPANAQAVAVRRNRQFVVTYQATVASDGSFAFDAGDGHASDRITTNDRIDLQVIDSVSRAIIAIVELTPFVSADGRSFLAMPDRETHFVSADGFGVTVPIGAFDVPTTIAVVPASPDAFQNVPSFANDLAYATSVELRFDGIAKKRLDVEMPLPAGTDTSRTWLLGWLGQSLRGPRVMIVDLVNAGGSTFTTGTPATGNLRVSTNLRAATNALAPGELRETLLGATRPGIYAVLNVLAPGGSDLVWGLLDGLSMGHDLFWDSLISLFAARHYIEDRRRIAIPLLSGVAFRIFGVDAATGLESFEKTYTPIPTGDPGGSFSLDNPNPDAQGPYPVYGSPFRVEVLELTIEGTPLTSARDFNVTVQGGIVSAVTTLPATRQVTMLNATRGLVGSRSGTRITVDGEVGDRIVLLVEETDVDPDAPFSIVFSEPVDTTNLAELIRIEVLDGTEFRQITNALKLDVDTEGRRVLVKRPASLQRGQRYRLVLDPKLRDGNGMRLCEARNPDGSTTGMLREPLYLDFTVRAPGGPISSFDIADGRIRDQALNGNVLFVSAMEGGITAYDVSNPATPAVAGTTSEEGTEYWALATDHHGRVFATGTRELWGILRTFRVEDFLPTVAGQPRQAAPRANAFLTWLPGTSAILGISTRAIENGQPEALPRKVQVLVQDTDIPYATAADFVDATSAQQTNVIDDFVQYRVEIDRQANFAYATQRITVENLTLDLRWSADAVNDEPARIGGIIARPGDRLRVRRNQRTYAVVSLFGYGIGVYDVNAMESNERRAAGFPERRERIVQTKGAREADEDYPPDAIADLGFSPDAALFERSDPSKIAVVAADALRGALDVSLVGADTAEPVAKRAKRGLLLKDHPRLAQLRAAFLAQAGREPFGRFNAVAPYRWTLDGSANLAAPADVNGDGVLDENERRIGARRSIAGATVTRDYVLIPANEYGLLVAEVGGNPPPGPYPSYEPLQDAHLVDVIWIPHGAYAVRAMSDKNLATVVDGEGHVLLVDLSQIDERWVTAENALFRTAASTLASGIETPDPRIVWRSQESLASGTLAPVVHSSGFVFAGKLLEKATNVVAALDPEIRITSPDRTSNLLGIVPAGIAAKNPRDNFSQFRVELDLPGGIDEAFSDGTFALGIDSERVIGAKSENTPAGWPQAHLANLVMRRLVPASLTLLRFQTGYNRWVSDPIVAIADPRAAEAYAWDANADRVAMGCHSCEPHAGMQEIFSLGRWFRIKPDVAELAPTKYKYLAEAGRLEKLLPTIPADVVRPPFLRTAAQAPAIAGGLFQETAHLHSGELETSATDFDFGGRAGWNVTFDRTYRSRSIGLSPLGAGWDSSIFRRLRELPGGNVEYRDGSGEVWEFVVRTGQPRSYSTPAGLGLTLEKVDTGWSLRDAQNRLTSFDSLGRIASESDEFRKGLDLASGNRIVYDYGYDGRLSAIIDPVGRRTEVGWNADGTLAGLEDWRGARRKLAFTYDTDRRLTRVELPAVLLGNATVRPPLEYAYQNASGSYNERLEVRTKLISIKDPIEALKGTNGVARVTFEYDAGRVKKQTWATGETATIDYTIAGPPSAQIAAATTRDVLGQERRYVIKPGTATPLGDRAHVDTLTEVGLDVWGEAAFGQLPSVVVPGAPVRQQKDRVTRFTYADGMLMSSAIQGLGETALSYTKPGDGNASLVETVITTPAPPPGEGGGSATSVPLPGATTLTRTFTYDGAFPSGVRSGAMTFSSLQPHRGDLDPESTNSSIQEKTVYDVRGRAKAAESKGGTDGSATIAAKSSIDYFEDDDAIAHRRGLPRKAVEGDEISGLATTYDYPTESRVIETAPRAVMTITDVDAWDRPVHVRTTGPDAFDLERYIDYDANGRVSRLRESKGSGFVETKYEYDVMGRSTAVEKDGVATVTSMRSTTTYNLGLRQVVSYAPGGATTTTTLDSLGRTKRSETVAGAGTPIRAEYAYDLAGNRVYSSNEQSAIAIAYDVHGRAIGVREPDGTVTTTEYNEFGQPLSVVRRMRETNELFAETRFTYTAAGRLESTKTRTEGSSWRETKSKWDGGGRTTRTATNGRAATAEFDLAGRMRKSAAGKGDVSTLEDTFVSSEITPNEDVAGTVYATEKGGRYTTLLQHNVFGGVLQRKLGTTRSLEWNRTVDSMGNVTKASEPGREATEWTVDARGAVEEEKFADGATNRYSYDASGAQSGYRDPADEETKTTVDDLGRPLQRFYADSTIETFRYEGARLESMTDRAGRMQSYRYDPVTGQLLQIFSNAQLTDSLGYDAAGRLVSWTTPDTRIEWDRFDYEGRPRLTRQTRYFGGGNSEVFEQEHQYNEHGERTGFSMPVRSGAELGSSWIRWISQDYDAMGNVTAIKRRDANGTNEVTLMTAQHRAAGRPDVRTLFTPAATIAREYAYDDETSQLRGVSVVVGENVVAGTAVEYDGLQVKTAQQLGVASSELSTRFSYDDRSRLLASVFSSRGDADPASASVTGSARERLTPADFRFAQDRTGVPSASFTEQPGHKIGSMTRGTDVRTFVHPGPDRVDDGRFLYIYDAKGRLIHAREKGSSKPRRITYIYNGANRVAGRRAEYAAVNDPRDDRAEDWKLEDRAPVLAADGLPADTTFVWDLVSDRLVSVYEAGTNGDPIRQIIHGDAAYDDPLITIAVEPATGLPAMLFPIFDEAAAGALQAVLNVNGEIVARNLPNDPYGAENVALAGAMIDRVALNPIRDAEGNLQRVEVTLHATEELDAATIATGSRLAIIDTTGAVLRNAPAAPALADPFTIRWTLSRAEWDTLLTDAPSTAALSIAATSTLRAANWPADTPILPPTIEDSRLLTTSSTPFDLRQPLPTLTPSLNASTLYELTTLALAAQRPEAEPLFEQLLTARFQALPFWEPVTGAIYVRNRWYSPATGTFLSPDPLGYVDSANLYTFAGGDPVNGRDPRGLADDNKPSCLGLGNKSCSELWAEASKVWFEPIDAVTTGSKELDQKLKSAAKKPVQVMLAPADMVMNVGVSPGKLVDRMDHALLGGGPAFGAEEGDFALTEGTVNDALMVLAPLEMLEGGLEVPSNFRRSTRSVKARHPDVGIQWGKGVQLQGMPWEDYLERQLPAGSRLPKNFKSFDFFADESGVAISAKTLDTSTLAKLKDPRQVYTSLKRNIDAAANFTSYELKGVSLSSDMITAREVHVAVPSSTTAEQWKEIKRAVDYGRGEGVKVIVTAVR